MGKIISWLGHRAREFFVHVAYLIQGRSNLSVIIFPSYDQTHGASNLRAFEIGKGLKKLGWRVMIVPKQLELTQRQRLIKFYKPKVALLQQSRHPLNRASLYPNIPTVFDLDDADYIHDAYIESLEDCCKFSKAVICGSKIVANWCSQYNSNSNVVWTGHPFEIKPTKLIPVCERKPIVAWASSVSLEYPVELNFVKVLMDRLSDKTTNFEFWLYGINSEEQADAIFGFLRTKGISVKYYKYMSYQLFVDTLSSVAIGINPLFPEQSPYSQGKSFGKILAYLTCFNAVIASDAADHRLFFDHRRNGMLANTLDEWVDNIIELLENAKFREEITNNAYKDYCLHLSTDVAAQKVSDILAKAIND